MIPPARSKIKKREGRGSRVKRKWFQITLLNEGKHVISSSLCAYSTAGVPTVQCNGVLGFIVTLYIYTVVLYCNPSESFVLPTNSCLLIWSYLPNNRTTSGRCAPPRRCCQQRAHATSTTHAPFHHSSLSSVLTAHGATATTVPL